MAESKQLEFLRSEVVGLTEAGLDIVEHTVRIPDPPEIIRVRTARGPSAPPPAASAPPG